MKVGWVMRLENADTSVSGVLRASKEAAEAHCASLKEKTQAEIVSMYTEYDLQSREVREFEHHDAKQLLKDLVDRNPLVLQQRDGKILIEIDKVT